MPRPLFLVVTVIASLSSACPSAPVIAPEPEPIVEPEPEPIVEPEPEPEPEQSSVDGDDKLGDRWRPLFRQWAAKDMGGIYTRVLDVDESESGATVVLLRHMELDECREGPTTLRISEDDGEPTFEEDHWGDDCCPGTTCVNDLPVQWNLRYITAIAAKDRAALAQLVPTKTKLTWQITAPDGTKTHKLSAKDVLAGKLDNAAGCGLLYGRSECTSIASDDKTGAFQCTCVAGGSSATFDWKKEGAGWVLVRIAESSH